MLTRYDGMLLDFPVNIIVGYDQSITYLALDLWSFFGLYNYISDITFITLIKSNLKIIIYTSFQSNNATIMIYCL